MAAKGTRAPKTEKKSDAQLVEEYMAALEHPLKAEMEALRTIIKEAHPSIGERIKWNAPSYYAATDMVTFNPRAATHVHLVFHHPAIESVSSPILEGEYKGRRMAYFTTMEEVKKGSAEIQRVLRELLNAG